MTGLSSLVRVITASSGRSIANAIQIVEKHSALFKAKDEEQIPVDADHSAMCKFETEDDITFEKVYKRVTRIKNIHGTLLTSSRVCLNEEYKMRGSV